MIIILCGYIYDVMTWLLEVYEIYFRYDVLYWDNLCMSILDHWRRGVYFI